ncbi:hypothetical protein [Halomarina rubra]|uniref:Small CPxCG-related zinc finger protein n=1 Tax=Halomarina rubra TaxID=2071873 RepID=A0ABD6B137_9EURY|nr:hypothetical protein [Halomarina rubra]
MQQQRIVCCSACGRAYTARLRDDGTFILPTTDGRCRCGADRFSEFESPTAGETPS